jgi:hypothetical protein
MQKGRSRSRAHVSSVGVCSPACRRGSRQGSTSAVPACAGPSTAASRGISRESAVAGPAHAGTAAVWARAESPTELTCARRSRLGGRPPHCHQTGCVPSRDRGTLLALQTPSPRHQPGGQGDPAPAGGPPPAAAETCRISRGPGALGPDGASDPAAQRPLRKAWSVFINCLLTNLLQIIIRCPLAVVLASPLCTYSNPWRKRPPKRRIRGVRCPRSAAGRRLPASPCSPTP